VSVTPETLANLSAELRDRAADLEVRSKELELELGTDKIAAGIEVAVLYLRGYADRYDEQRIRLTASEPSR
jgi:hypothetical protein